MPNTRYYKITFTICISVLIGNCKYNANSKKDCTYQNDVNKIITLLLCKNTDIKQNLRYDDSLCKFNVQPSILSCKYQQGASYYKLGLLDSFPNLIRSKLLENHTYDKDIDTTAIICKSEYIPINDVNNEKYMFDRKYVFSYPIITGNICVIDLDSYRTGSSFGITYLLIKVNNEWFIEKRFERWIE